MDEPNKEQQAKEAWLHKAEKEFDDNVLEQNAYLLGIEDLQSMLIEELEKDKIEYAQKGNGWKRGSQNYETYDLAVRICDRHISLVKTTEPKKK